MTRTLIAVLALASCAAVLGAQAKPAPGDLIPRSGTLAYMTSDSPDTLYRLFGRDQQGGWKLKSWALGMMEREHETREDEESIKRDREIFDWVFGSYEAIQHVEIGLIDVTLDGPKYLVHVRTAEGKGINPQPEFLAEFLDESKEYKGVKYVLYRVPGPEVVEPVEPDNPEGDDDMPRNGPPRNALGDNRFGMDRYYVAATSTGLLISNFETTIREAIDRVASGDYSESLSGREEFIEWQKDRSKHDFSVFVIGREIQNAIERLLPSEDQAGVDAEGIYRGIDKWLQFREYRYIVMDFDFDDANRGVTVAASFKTRRQTRLLEKLAIEPAEFKLLKYVPAGAMLTAGLQLGDAATTFENLKELGYDLEDWVREIEDGFGGSVPPMPPDDMPVPEEPKSQEPGEFDEEEEHNSKLDRSLGELEEMLKEYGTSLDEVLAVLGTEVVFFSKADMVRAAAMERSHYGMDDLFGSSNMGIAIGLKDVAKAKAIIANARERDSEGAFRGFAAVEYQGAELNVSPEHPFGYAFTADALLIVITSGVQEEDASAHVTAGLKAMIDAGRASGTGDSFVRNGSKFIEFDMGAASRATAKLNEDVLHRLDRYAAPPLSSDPMSSMQDMKIGLRIKEYKDGVELALRITGLPNFGDLLDSDASPFSGPSGDRNAYSYSEDNLKTLAGVMRRRAENGEGLNLDEMTKSEAIRKGVLQSPFDARWQGEKGDIGWTTLDQLKRDREGNLPEGVDAKAAEMIEGNETAGFRSFVLAEGDIAAWLKDWKTGFIVAYQEKADTLGGHMVLYADGQVGWLSGKVFKEALALNAAGEPVPALDRWEDDKDATEPPRRDGPRMPEDDPWFPGPKD